jgi:hypothetical protein
VCVSLCRALSPLCNFACGARRRWLVHWCLQAVVTRASSAAAVAAGTLLAETNVDHGLWAGIGDKDAVEAGGY